MKCDHESASVFSRRGVLGSLGGALGAFCTNWLHAEQGGEGVPLKNPAAKARSVILIFNAGAPSHLDLWDPKPEATDSVRGEFATIATNVPGIHVTELLPQMAQRMDKLAIVRTLHHKHGGHNSGMHWSIVGRPYPKDSTLINPSPTDHPSFGTLTGWLAARDGYTGATPPYVITPYPHCDSKVYITPGQYGGCLGVRYDPFVLNADPNDKNFQVRDLALTSEMTKPRFNQRLGLLQNLSQSPAPISSTTAAEIDTFHQRAASMVLSGKAAEPFDLSKEPDAVRERYGRHSWGQSHLLARRLIEAGSRFVTTVNGPSISWDTHKDNFNRLKNSLVPPMERAYAALLDDLEERGLLDTTLVIWMGDFGRTPKINKEVGRDHWPACYSAVLAGGGIRGGQVIGKTDSIGAHPQHRPTTPADIHATVFTALGYDIRGIHYQTADGRPIPLSEGDPIPELVG